MAEIIRAAEYAPTKAECEGVTEAFFLPETDGMFVWLKNCE